MGTGSPSCSARAWNRALSTSVSTSSASATTKRNALPQPRPMSREQQEVGVAVVVEHRPLGLRPPELEQALHERVRLLPGVDPLLERGHRGHASSEPGSWAARRPRTGCPPGRARGRGRSRQARRQSEARPLRQPWTPCPALRGSSCMRLFSPIGDRCAPAIRAGERRPLLRPALVARLCSPANARDLCVLPLDPRCLARRRAGRYSRPADGASGPGLRRRSGSA